MKSPSFFACCSLKTKEPLWADKNGLVYSTVTVAKMGRLGIR